MKISFSRLMLGSVMALTLAACTSTTMQNDAATGSSTAGATASSGAMTQGSNENATRGAAPVNCTVTGTDASNTAAMTPGTKCPTESQ